MLTAQRCAAELTRHGWAQKGTGPNQICIYLDRDSDRIVLIVVPGDPVTSSVLREASNRFRHAEFAAGRRQVAICASPAPEDVAEEAARQDITLIGVDGLENLVQALQATEIIADRHRALELRALTRPHDAPHATPLQVASGAAGEAVGPLFETDLVACFVRDRGGDTLVISFANQWVRHNGRAFWADAATKTLGLSVVAFVTKEPCWYPPDDMAILLPAVASWIGERFPDRVAIGHSQGGHAAIKYAAALGAGTVLAFSPQSTTDRRLIPDDRVNRYHEDHRHSGMAPAPGDAAGQIFLFHDPHDGADSAHARAIAASLPVIPISVPFAGHATDRGLADPTRFSRLLEAADTGSRHMMQAFMARERAVRSERPVQMALTLAGRRPRTAAAILHIHGGRWTPDQIASVCYRLAKAGQARLALAPALRAADAAPGLANPQGTAALIALEARELDVAAERIERALAIEPHSAKWRDADKRIRALKQIRAVPVAV